MDPHRTFDAQVPLPTNALVTPLLTDLYQITMTYAHWKNNRHNDSAIFELFFRKNPFGGEYTIYCGLDEVLKHLSNFHFSNEDIEYLKTIPALSTCDPGFFEYLANLDCSGVQLYSMREGTIAFPRVPLITLAAPLGIGQLLETTLLTLVNYPSLIATNAARMVNAARGKNAASEDPNTKHLSQCSRVPKCAEFGLRRAQGPDGGFSASKYSFVGGFDATSNVQAGKLLHFPVVGTHAHAFVQSYVSLSEVEHLKVKDSTSGEEVVLLERVLHYRNNVLQDKFLTTNNGELAAFVAYAAAFPGSFLCLIDTYETLQSGNLNFCMVAMVLDDLGYTPRGIRLDSGDLAYLSLECARMYDHLAEKYKRPFFRDLDIVASNDINEDILHALNKEGHAITLFGIGTNLVTCQAQPALGCVYKLVEIKDEPRIKLSQDIAKVLIPGRKKTYRLYGKAGFPLLDVMVRNDEEPPQANKQILCRHPFIERKRALVTPSKVVPLHEVVYDMTLGVINEPPGIESTKAYVAEQVSNVRPDILRKINPTPYKISVSQVLFAFLHDLWQLETPVTELD
mmetsp:Transcript_9119/g.14038  ORF Transcript_9119/g.14038 Transcript_9119/m.14038 type:complete len:567 (+) Transcript_9119:115-1815(+)